MERINSCDICQKSKPPNRAFSVDNMPIVANNKLDTVFADVIGPLPHSKGRWGNHFALILIDLYSNM